MPPAESQAPAPKCRLWLRRLGVGESPFTVRFEVDNGKGILRVTRPGVLIDPPARQTGMEERLSTQQLRTARFILVWDGGRARQGHHLSRLDESTLERVEADRWHELEVVSDDGLRYLMLAVLPAAAPAPAPAPRAEPRRPSLADLRQELDSLTFRADEDKDADGALDSITGPVPAPRKPPPGSDDAFVNSKTLVDEGADPAALVAPEAMLLLSFPGPAAALGRPASPAPAPAAAAPAAEESDALALGEADGSEDAETLSLGEADGTEDAEALPLGDGAERLVTETMAAPPPPPAASPTALAGFADEDEEAAFSVDLPSHRQSTEHLSVHRDVGDAVTSVDMSFAREEPPPIEHVAPPPGNGVFDQPGAPPAPSGRSTRPRRLVPEPVGSAEFDAGEVRGQAMPLVRHLRRRLEEQRQRIAELEQQLAELQGSQRRG